MAGMAFVIPFGFVATLLYLAHMFLTGMLP